MLNAHTIKRILFFITCLLLPLSVFAVEKINPGCKGEFVQLQTENKQSFTSYIVGPKNASQGILLIHGWWGLNKEIETWANKYAISGYRVIAIDLYNNKITTNPQKARKLMNKVKQSEANEKYLAAVKFLSAPDRKIAVIGRSYGASQAFHAALVAAEKISATIVYYPYGELMTNKKILSSIKSPVLGHFARDDFFLTPDKLKQFRSAVKKSDIKMSFNVYDARHGFDKSTGKNYNPYAHALAQDRTQQFLNSYLN